MKQSILALSICAAMLPVMAQAKTVKADIKLENTLNKNRKDCPVVLKISEIAPNLNVTCATLTDSGKEIATQIDDMNRDGVADEVAFVVDLPAKGKKTLTLELSDEGEQKQYTPRVWANFMLVGRKKGQTVDVREITVPGYVDFYNMVHGHGPMFESELVGYRVYFNQKQTLDPYGKFNKGLELSETTFYPNDEHRAKGYGDDVLMAGNSCGVGAFKGWDGTQATHVEPIATRTERLISAGPVRTVVEVEVRDWDYQDSKLNMVNRYTLYAGHRDLQVDVEFDKPLANQTFSTGVERIMGNETVSWSDHDGLVASWGRHYPVTDTVKFAKETIGIATYVPKKNVVKEASDPSNFLYIVQAPGEKGLTYYTMFTSKKETFGFDDFDAWTAYLPKWKEEIESPVKVTVTTKGK